MTEKITTVIYELHLDRLIPVLKAYGFYIYETLGLTAGKNKLYKEPADFPLAKYSSPQGCFLLGMFVNEVAGCLAYRNTMKKAAN